MYNDMYSFDPAFNIWSRLSSTSRGSESTTVPAARYGHGFTSAADNMIYLFGGVGSDGKFIQLLSAIVVAHFTIYLFLPSNMCPPCFIVTAGLGCL